MSVWVGRAISLVLLAVAAVLLGRWLGADWSWLVPVIFSTLVGPALIDHWRRRDRDARGQ